MCSLHLTHPSVHTWSSGQPTVQRPGSSRGPPAGAGIRTHNLGLPRVSSPTLYPLGQRLAVFGGRRRMSTIPRKPSQPWSIGVETSCFGGAFLQRGQDDCTVLRGGWMGPCIATFWPTSSVRALKMGRGWVLQHDNDPKHTARATKGVAP